MNSISTTDFKLVLASTSTFRAMLLEKLRLPFETSSPDINENRQEDESAEQLVTRLAQEKAHAVEENFPNALIIGSDQVACIDGDILGKPGNRQNAIEQLTRAAGKVVTFYTGLCLYNSATKRSQCICEPFKVHFKPLDSDQIQRYLDAEQPYNCAGSFKSEGLGIALFKKLEGDDPNALIGLPLIRLVSMLEQEGHPVP